MTTTRTLTQQASDRVYASQRAQHRAWLKSEAHNEGLVLLATDPIDGAARAAKVLDDCWKRLQGIADPETVTRPSGVVVTRSRATEPFDVEAVAS